MNDKALKFYRRSNEAALKSLKEEVAHILDEWCSERYFGASKHMENEDDPLKTFSIIEEKHEPLISLIGQ